MPADNNVTLDLIPSTATVDTAQHALILGGVSYPLTKKPALSAPLVSRAKQEILRGLSLETVLADLDRAARLLFLAYNGVTGTEVAANVSSRQKSLGDLCWKSYELMRIINDASRDIVTQVIEAYKWLLKAKEDAAVAELADCATHAQAMAEQCGTLAAAFKQLETDTRQDSTDVEKALAKQGKAIEELKDLQAKMKADLAEKQTKSDELRAAIEDVKEEITQAREDEDKQSTLALVGQIASALTGAIGAGVGMFAMSQNPTSTLMSKSRLGEGGAPADPEATSEVETKKKKDADAKKAEADAKKVLDEADSKLTEADTKVEQAKEKHDKKAKDLEDAQGEADAEKVTAAANAETEAKKELEDAEEKQTAAKKEKDAAESSHSAAAAAVAAAAQDLKNSMQKFADEASKREDASRSLRLKLLDQKHDLEKQKRETLGDIAKLTSYLTSSAEKQKLDESAYAALEISVWAFCNIWAALTDAQHFWEGMSIFCGRLGTPEVQTRIARQRKFVTETQERLDYYSSEDFLPYAVGYLVRWCALESISMDYMEKSKAAYEKVRKNITISPTVAYAREHLPQLKAELEAEIAADQARVDQSTRELEETRTKLLSGVES